MLSRSGAGISGTLYTVTCWARIVTDRNAFSTVWIIHEGSSTAGYSVLHTLSNGTTFNHESLDGGGNANSNLVAASTAQWRFLAVRVNGTTVDVWWSPTAGGALSTANYTGFTNITPTDFSIGAISWVSEPFNGQIANVIVTNAALSD